MPLYYLAYGSNLHPLRLLRRVPSARLIGKVEMPGFRLAFHKRSIGSGKCLLYPEQGPESSVHCALYEFDVGEEINLDRHEGVGQGYTKKFEQVPFGGTTYNTFLYMAESAYIDPTLAPFHWYKNLVLAGARFHNFPVEYIAGIEAVSSIDDPNLQRNRDNENLIAKMAQFPPL